MKTNFSNYTDDELMNLIILHEFGKTFHSGLSINLSASQVFFSDKRVNLTHTEYKLLSELVKNRDRVITHSTLFDKIWGSEYAVDSGFVKKYIYRLRSKLKSIGIESQIILNERGVGYRFVRPTNDHQTKS